MHVRPMKLVAGWTFCPRRRAGAVSGRGASLEAPAGAGRGPLVVVVGVLLLVAVALVVGLSGSWFALVLAPAALATLWIGWSVVAAMRRSRKEGEDEGS